MTAAKEATMSIEQIAEAAGVGRSAVSNWRARHQDFPTPDSNGRFSVAEIEQWLIDRRKINEPIKLAASLWSLMDRFRSMPLAAPEIFDLVVAGLVYLEAAERFATHHPDPAADWSRIRSATDDRLHDELLDAATLLEQEDSAVEGLLTVGLRPSREISATDLRALFDALDQAASSDTLRFEVFEDVVQHFESLDRFHGMHATPDDLVELAVRLGGSDAKVIFDPALGEGGLLLSAAIHPDRAEPPAEIHGVEQSRDIARRARARFYLYGIEANIHCNDALRASFEDLPQADLVVVDPPLGHQDWGDNELYSHPKWQFGAPPRNDATFAWVQTALAALTQTGRAVVFTAPGPLFRHGRESTIRQALIDAGAIEAVVELPARVRPETNIRLNLILVQAPNSRPRRDEVLFVDATALGSSGRSMHHFEEADLDRIVTAVQAFRTGEPLDDEIAWTGDAEAIASHDYALEPSRYRPLPDIDVDALIDRYNSLRTSLPALIEASHRHSQDVANASAEPATYTPIEQDNRAPARERLSAVATILRGVRTPPSENPEDPVVYGGQEVVQGSMAPLRHAALAGARRPVTVSTGDLVVTLTGTSIRAAVVTERHDGAVLGMECAVIRPVTHRVDRSWLHTWLQSSDFADQVERSSTMTVTKRISVRDLSELTVPLPNADTQQRSRDALNALDRAVSAANELRTALEELRKLEVDVLVSQLPNTPPQSVLHNTRRRARTR